KILVPLDGSTLAEGVLPYVRSMARAIHVPVELLRVNDLVQPRAYVPAARDGEYLDKIAASFSGTTDVKCSVELGNPAGVIVDRVATQPDTLIAMATHGYSGAQRWLLGSVAEKVLHASTNHLLLVRPAGGDTSEARLNTILVPLDGSGLAEKVLPTVTDLAACMKLKVLLVHVLIRFYFGSPDAFLPVFGANIPNQQDLWAQASAEASQYLANKVEQLRAQGLPQVSSALIEGTAEGAAAAIVDLAKETPDNLVALSTHGRSGIGRWLLGSVTERVVRYSNDPVLVIRPQS
ncbi:MAG TPA: universal stress protein, partial [Candidatus Binatia bacterium]|nr:universal stress protein [Candidatus Binatia bacterium]